MSLQHPIHSALTADSVVLAVEKRSAARPVLILLLLAMLAGAAFYAYTHQEMMEAFVRGPQLARENSELRDALEQARLNQEIEVGTRQELERRIAALNEQLKEEQAELEFLRSANGAGGEAP